MKIGRKLKKVRKHRKLEKMRPEDSPKIRAGRCLNISCLNAATNVIFKNISLVKNFLAQEKRLQVKLQLMGK